jgi:hypothetical protein
MELMDDYAGPFDAGFHLGRLSRRALAGLGREYMLFAHFLDRGLMPLVGKRFGAAAMTGVACDEWIGSSPVYNPRVRKLLGIGGDGAVAILKAFQLDIGFPHQYMDVGYELVDDSLGFFWLKRCGALEDIMAISPGNERAVIQLCHHMEDPTFPATVSAVNRRAVISPVHRPPLAAGHVGPVCRWQVAVTGEDQGFMELPLTEKVRASRAARFEYAPIGAAADGGMADYSGDFKPDFVLEDLSQPVLARQCKEIALDAHLLMRASFLSVRERYGDELVEEFARDQWAGIAAVSIPRLRARLRIAGDDMAAILKTLQIDPALPQEYVRSGAQLIDARRGRFWIEPCEAVAAGEPEAWTTLLAHPAQPGIDRVVATVNARARLRRIDPAAIDVAPAVHAWEVVIDPDAEPLAESPIAEIVRFSNVSKMVFR